MTNSRPELIADHRCHTGEGPLWHPDEKRLYWVDIPNGRLFRYDPTTGEHDKCYETDTIGGFTIQADGTLLLFEDKGSVEVWRDGKRETVIEEIPAERDSRFNDVITDPNGRVFCGTMPTDERLGRLYRLDCDGTFTEVVDSVDIPNGLGFTADREHMYFTESIEKKIYKYKYDEDTGGIAERKVFLDLTDEEGIPDGMTVDAEGYVWSARWDGGCLVRYAPDGTEDRRVEFPAKKVSSVIFGGENYADLYVTTALGPGEGTPGTKVEEGVGAGALFRVETDVPGRPEFRSQIGL